MTFPVDLDDILQSIEQKYLREALLQTGGAKKKAADLVGVNFRSFRYRLQKFGISDD
ncbi:MAG: helix-turn-helix domain-containing protein [Bdellovibrionales bacterium]|nr:helix-turn-helix domain-containing protein [Bdellovibrionales bacterium]